MALRILAYGLLVAFAASSFACSGERSAGRAPASPPPQSPNSTPQDSVYFVRGTDSWALKEAVNPTDTPIPEVEPSLDWYAEYERFPTPNRSEHVRLSGHTAGLDEMREDLVGFRFDPLDVKGRSGLGGVGADGPNVVLFEVETGYTIMVLSYELDVEALADWTASLRLATEGEWVSSGGKVME